MTRHVDVDRDAFVPIGTPGMAVLSQSARNRNSLIHLAWTQSRLSHAYRKDAAMWERAGNYRNYADCRDSAKRLWRDARWHLNLARTFKENEHA